MRPVLKRLLSLAVSLTVMYLPCCMADEIQEGPAYSFDFVENRGQWADEPRFKVELPDGALFLTDRGFVYHFVSLEDMGLLEDVSCGGAAHKDSRVGNKDIRYHAYRVNFVGANSDVSYITRSRRSYYHNYFIGNDPSKWVGKVALYGEVEQQNIYNGVNLKLYSQGARSIKYDLVVAAGADPAQIAFSFEGVTPQINEEGHMVLRTSVNEVIEKAPYTYQEIDGRRVMVKSNYTLVDGQLRFAFPDGYNPDYALVIDPDLIYATYSGGIGGSNYAHSTTYDDEGNAYSAAQASTTGWPTTIGAYQTTFPSVTAAINKYNPDGSSLIYSTYFGGSTATCQPSSLRVSNTNELYLTGTVTTSTMPVTTGAFQTYMNGLADIYIARFSDDGSVLLASTYIGGSGIEASLSGSSDVYNNLGDYRSNPVDVALDQNGAVWITSTSGSSNFPVTANAYQGVRSGGFDAVLFKMSPGLDTLIYSTYLGGRGWDGGLGIEYNSRNNTVGVVGYTASNNFPTTTGAYKAAAPGGVDGFALLMENGSYQLLASTYLGTSGSDIAMRLAFDCADNFFVSGTTNGNYRITNNTAQGATDGFIFVDKLNPLLSASIASTRTSSRHQGNIYVAASALAVDICGNIMVASIGGIQHDVPLTADAFQTKPSAFYFSVFKPNFSGLKFGSYFGLQEHYHPGMSRIDPHGRLYHSVCSNTPDFPITPRSFSPVKKNASLDNITFKFDFDAVFIVSEGPRSGGGANTDRIHCVRGCKPGSIHYKVKPKPVPTTLKYHISGDAINGTDYQWIPDSITIPAGASNAKIEIKGLLPVSAGGPKHVVISMIAPCDCEGMENILSRDTIWIFDSLYVNIPKPPDTVCSGTAVDIEAEIATTLNYVWSPAQQISSPNSLKIQVAPTKTTVYKITAFQPGAPATCPSRTASYQVVVEPFPEVRTRDLITCSDDSVDVVAVVGVEDIKYNYRWSPPDYLRNSQDPVNKFKAPPGEYIKTFIASSPVANCADSSSSKFTILPPFFDFDWLSPKDTTINYGDSIQLNSGSEAIAWYWTPSTYLSSVSDQSPWARPLTSIIYTVTGMNQYGCKGSADIKINVDYKSNIRIPSAFSPNGDGLNDVFRVDNVVLEKLIEFKIFNRFGQLVFETRNPSEGWNGVYDGKDADIGVYFYTILLESTPENKVLVFKGDVTLIR